jgi:hypothetical protein
MARGRTNSWPEAAELCGYKACYGENVRAKTMRRRDRFLVIERNRSGVQDR